MQEVYIDEISYTLVYDTPTLQRKSLNVNENFLKSKLDIDYTISQYKNI